VLCRRPENVPEPSHGWGRSSFVGLLHLGCAVQIREFPTSNHWVPAACRACVEDAVVILDTQPSELWPAVSVIPYREVWETQLFQRTWLLLCTSIPRMIES